MKHNWQHFDLQPLYLYISMLQEVNPDIIANTLGLSVCRIYIIWHDCVRGIFFIIYCMCGTAVWLHMIVLGEYFFIIYCGTAVWFPASFTTGLWTGSLYKQCITMENEIIISLFVCYIYFLNNLFG